MVQTDSILTAERPTVMVICGPTASGKSAIALEAAERLQGEVICMDSMQIYDKMDIGTAKPTLVEQNRVPHHLFGSIPPSDSYSVAEYRVDALRAVDLVLSRGRLPILVGGTGLYLRALRHELSMGNAPKDDAYRSKLEAIAATDNGKNRLHQQLQQIDPVTAKRLHGNDVRRVIRALEVHHVTNIPFSEQQAQENTHYNFHVYGITMDRQKLYERINQRVCAMFEQGLVQEVSSLLAAGIPPSAQSMQGIGYKEVVPYLYGEMSLDECISLIQQNTRHYAKRQWTWFRREAHIHWLDSIAPDVVKQLIHDFCGSEGNRKHENDITA